MKTYAILAVGTIVLAALIGGSSAYYGYGGYGGYGHGSYGGYAYGKRHTERAHKRDAGADANADPYYGGYKRGADADADAFYGYGAYGLGLYGKSAPCVNAANIPVPCTYGKRDAGADANADPR